MEPEEPKFAAAVRRLHELGAELVVRWADEGGIELYIRMPIGRRSASELQEIERIVTEHRGEITAILNSESVRLVTSFYSWQGYTVHLVGYDGQGSWRFRLRDRRGAAFSGYEPDEKGEFVVQVSPAPQVPPRAADEQSGSQTGSGR